MAATSIPRARIAAAFLAVALAACARDATGPKAGEGEPVTRQVYLMGTQATLSVQARDRAEGVARIEGFIAILEEAEAQLSVWRPDSLISRLNRHPVDEEFHLEPKICRLFERVVQWRVETGGAFDPAVSSLISAWGLHEAGRIPDPAQLRQALSLSGMSLLQWDAARCVLVRRAEVGIDTGGFGKGAALDWIRESPDADDEPWLIDLGGQVAVGGPKREWPVELADPRFRDRGVLRLPVTAGGLATSGGSERDLETEGQRIGHILDPRDGRPAAYRGSVTVWHESALTADILSTALYVMGPEKGLAWARDHGVAALFLPASGGFRSSAEFRKKFPDARWGPEEHTETDR